MYKVNIINIYVKPKVACSDRFLRYFRIQNVIIFVVSVVALRAKDFLLAQMPTPYNDVSHCLFSFRISHYRTRQHAHAHQHYELLTLLGVQ